MNHPARLTILFTVLILFVAGAASGQGTPVAANSSVTFMSAQPAVSMFLLPNGTGSSLSNCYGPGGVPASASLILTVRDINGIPVPNVPNGDMRLEEVGSSLSWCANNFYPPPFHAPNCADASTNLAGQTAFTLSYHGGGSLPGACRVFVLEASGLWAPLGQTVPVSFNSPDITGDLIINLSDIVLFAQDLGAAPAPYRSDFNWDGVINLSDVVLFAQSVGVACP